MELERRAFTLDALKIERADKEPPRMVGHAAVFNQTIEIGRWFRERVAPGAFSRAIKEDDVRALFNHDPNFVLGRNTAGTLLMDEDGVGLAIQIFPPDTQIARDLTVSMERGDVSQMSFGFRVRKEQWDDSDQDIPLRTLLEVELFDVSPVTFPAYPTTDVGLRMLEAYRKDHPRAPSGGLTTLNAAAIIRGKKQTARVHGY